MNTTSEENRIAYGKEHCLMFGRRKIIIELGLPEKNTGYDPGSASKNKGRTWSTNSMASSRLMLLMELTFWLLKRTP
jgi:hypothetical protein